MPIGCYNSYSDCVYYGGTFDGAGHTVSGLAINNAKTYQALFGYVKGGTIQGLTVKGALKDFHTSSPMRRTWSYGKPVTTKTASMRWMRRHAKGYAGGIW